LWSPSEALDFRVLSGYLRERGDEGESDVFLAPGAASTQVSGLLQQLGLTPGCDDNVPRNRTLCSVDTNKLDLEARDITLLGEYRTAGAQSLKATISSDRYEILRIEDDAIQLFAPMLFYHDAERSRSFQGELTFASPDDRDFTWLVGGFYYRNTYERGDHGSEPMFGANGDLAYDPIWPALFGLPLAIPGQSGIHDSQLVTHYLSAFGQMVWHATERFGVTAGVRWQEEEKDAVLNNSVTAPGLSLISAVLTPTVTLGGAVVNGALDRRSDNVPWSITPEYRFSDNVMAYFTVARGSKAGGFNTGFGDAPLNAREFGDETIRHYELGTKLSSDDRRLVLSAAAFATHRSCWVTA
jgi:iron complex outermembrane receptor protein